MMKGNQNRFMAVIDLYKNKSSKTVDKRERIEMVTIFHFESGESSSQSQELVA